MQGKVVIVTGGGRGIGRAICRRFGADSAKVVAVARCEEELAETRRLVEQEGGICTTFTADIGEFEQVDAMVGFAKRQYGGVDILVNNAGMACHGDIATLDHSTFDAMIAVNVKAPFYTCRAVWPIMRQGGGGIIINISSVAAIDPFPGFAAYGATKSYVDGLTHGLAKEGRELGIRVYGIGPGAVDTRMLRGPFPDFPADQCLQPADIAEMAWLMTQPACQYSVGQTIYVRKT